jgi:hypothetical protein
LVVIDSPTNNAHYSTHSLTLIVHAAAPSWSFMINLVLLADWLENGERLFYHMDQWPGQFFIAEGITVTTMLVDVPEGNHTITVAANEYTSIAGSASVHFAIDSSPTSTTTTPTPAPLDDPSYPEGLDDWLPLGTFGIISPTNRTYTTGTLTLSVGGVIIAGSPYLSYSLDGGPRIPITLEVKKVSESMMQRSMSGSIALPPLTNGSHVIVLFADLGVESRKGKQTIYFDVAAG